MRSWPFSQTGYALLTIASQDSTDLKRYEKEAERADTVKYLEWVAEFAEDPSLLRKAPPAEVAALVRNINFHSNWLDDTDLLPKLQAGIAEQLPALDVEVVLGDTWYIVDTVRYAQQPWVIQLRTVLLTSLDNAVRDADEDGTDLTEALITRLAQRGLSTCPAPVRESTAATPPVRPRSDQRMLTFPAREQTNRGVGR